MNAKEFLKSYALLHTSIELAKEQRDHFRDLAEKITVGTENLPRSTEIADKVGKNAAAIADLELEINDKIAGYIAQYHRIIRVINRIPDKNQKLVIEAMYINRLTLSETAEMVGYCYSSVERFHLAGLEAVEKIINLDNV